MGRFRGPRRSRLVSPGDGWFTRRTMASTVDAESDSTKRRLEVLFTPADFEQLPARGPMGATCVVFDVLRATSSMITALAHGAREVLPVRTIEEALAVRASRPDVLLAGEREGQRIGAGLTGGVEFDLGNSPREFTADRVAGRCLAMTTTNGTRALRACAGAGRVLVGAFLNLGRLIAELRAQPPRELIVIASGTFEQAALEDTLAAGALVDALWPLYAEGEVADSAAMARALHQLHGHDLEAALRLARNGRRLLAQPALRDDVPFCARKDAFPLLAVQQEGRVTAAAGETGAYRPACDSA